MANEDRQCWGRTRNLSRCGRTVVKRIFCPEHRLQPILLIVFIAFTIVPGTLGYFSFCNRKPLPSDNRAVAARNRIIAEEYRMAVNVFLIKFRMILHCLPLHDPIEPRIEEAFHPGVDLLKTGVELELVDADLIEQIFTTYDFSEPMVNYEPSDGGRQLTNAEWLHTEFRALNQKCRETLNKYASTGDPRLIERIEIMHNRTENLLNPIGSRDYSRLSDDDLHWLGDLFIQIKLSWDVIDEIVSETQEDVPSNKADAGDGK